MDRRQYLKATIVTVATGAFAGCSGGGGGGGGGTSGGGGTTAPSGGGGAATTGGQQTIGGEGMTSGGGRTTRGGMTTGGGMTTTGGTATGGGTTQFSATVNVLSDDEWGEILVGPNGLSLYLFVPDSRGKSTCAGQCATVWPPLMKKKPTKSSAVKTKIGTFTRNDGSTQVQAGGHPLYYYQPDQKPGDTTGQDIESFGGEWYLLAPDGSEVEEEAEGGNATTGSGSGSGY